MPNSTNKANLVTPPPPTTAGALEGIISTSAGSIPCAATGATISLDFTAAAAVVEASVPDGSGTAVISSDGGIVTFELSGTLEATPTAFSVVLEFCNALPGEEIVASVVYSDDEGNEPDLSALDGGWPTPICGEWGVCCALEAEWGRGGRRRGDDVTPRGYSGVFVFCGEWGGRGHGGRIQDTASENPVYITFDAVVWEGVTGGYVCP